MGHTIIKPKCDEDFYAVYSSVVDSFICWGTRAELEAEYEDANPERLERADTHGSSALYASPAPHGWHESQVLVVNGVETSDGAYGVLVPREQIAEFCATGGEDGRFHPPAGMCAPYFLDA